MGSYRTESIAAVILPRDSRSDSTGWMMGPKVCSPGLRSNFMTPKFCGRQIATNIDLSTSDDVLRAGFTNVNRNFFRDFAFHLLTVNPDDL